jgi:hypothetical protein
MPAPPPAPTAVGQVLALLVTAEGRAVDRSAVRGQLYVSPAEVVVLRPTSREALLDRVAAAAMALSVLLVLVNLLQWRRAEVLWGAAALQAVFWLTRPVRLRHQLAPPRPWRRRGARGGPPSPCRPAPSASSSRRPRAGRWPAGRPASCCPTARSSSGSARPPSPRCAVPSDVLDWIPMRILTAALALALALPAAAGTQPQAAPAAGKGGAGAKKAAAPATPRRLPFVTDDYQKALAEARARNVPLVVDVWAPW